MKTVAVFFGSRSAEHDISIITALSAIIKPLELTRQYKVEAVYISKDGSWYWDEKLKDIRLYQSGEIDEFLKRAPKAHILFDEGLTLVKSSQFAGRKTYKKIDVAFPATHGTHGEDGELMGIFEMANVPYVGCDPTASALAMDKVYAKLVAQSQGFLTPKMVFFNKQQYEKDVEGQHEHISKTLRYPLFVKPARLGSSIGITKIDSEKELTNAIEVALHYDSKAIVEEAVQNLLEVTLPIIGNTELKVANIEQPMTKNDGVFDFETKYLQKGKGKKLAGQRGSQGYSNLQVDISDKLKQEITRVATGVYKALGCEGIARIDLLVDTETDAVYFNEVNPLPGSLYAHNWRAAGISSVDLVDSLIGYAEERWKRKQQFSTTFTTNFLKQF